MAFTREWRRNEGDTANGFVGNEKIVVTTNTRN